MIEDLFPAGLFVLGIILSATADLRLRRTDSRSFSNGFITVAGAGLVFVACATAIR